MPGRMLCASSFMISPPMGALAVGGVGLWPPCDLGAHDVPSGLTTCPRGSRRALGAHAPSSMIPPPTGLRRCVALGCSCLSSPRGSRPELYDSAPYGAQTVCGVGLFLPLLSSGLTPRAL